MFLINIYILKCISYILFLIKKLSFDYKNFINYNLS